VGAGGGCCADEGVGEVARGTAVVTVEDIAGGLAEAVAAWVEDADLGERTPDLWIAVYDGHGVRRTSTQLTARQAGDVAALLSGGIRAEETRTDEVRMGGSRASMGYAVRIAGRLGGWRCGGAPAAAVLLVADLGAPSVVATVRLGLSGAGELMEVLCLHMQVRRWEREITAHAPFPAGSRVRIRADARVGAGDTGTVARVRVEPGPRSEDDSVLVFEVHLDHGPDDQARPYSSDQLASLLPGPHRYSDRRPDGAATGRDVSSRSRSYRPRHRVGNRVMADRVRADRVRADRVRAGRGTADSTTAWIELLDQATSTTRDDPAAIASGVRLAWVTAQRVQRPVDVASEMAWATAVEALADQRDLLDQIDLGPGPGPGPGSGQATATAAALPEGPHRQDPLPAGPLRDGPELRRATVRLLDALHARLLADADRPGVELVAEGRDQLHAARAAVLLHRAADALR
jgi:hypothetical protein